MIVEFIDTHTHIYDAAFDGCEEEVISRAADAGVSVLLQPDVDSTERERMFNLSGKYPGVLYPMLGLYPGSVNGSWQEELDSMLPWKESHPEIVAVGEIGLDYHYGAEFRKEQKEVLRIQLEAAARWGLPVNIHLREATGDFLDILRDCAHLGLRGNLHAFSLSAQTFRQVCRYGDFMAGIGGVITFRNSSLAREVKEIPLERILLETDSPYLTPVPHRGERNESAYVPIIASFLAGCKGTSVEEVAAVTTANARKLFGL